MAEEPSPKLIAEVEKTRRRFASHLKADIAAAGNETTYPTAVCVVEDDDGTVWEFTWPDGKPQYRRM